jgi:hypothetical protein
LSFACVAKSQIIGLRGEFSTIDDIYDCWKNSFNFQHVNVKCDTFFYCDKIDEDVIGWAQDIFMNDSIIEKVNYFLVDTVKERLLLTRDERILLRDELELLKQKRWEDNMYPNSKRLKLESVKALIEEVDNSNDIIERKLCKTVYVFSDPIIFRDGQFCIFFSGEWDILSKFGEGCLFKSVNGKWKKYASLCRWGI